MLILKFMTILALGKVKLITFSCILLDTECKRTSKCRNLGTQYSIYIYKQDSWWQVGLYSTSAKIEQWRLNHLLMHIICSIIYDPYDAYDNTYDVHRVIFMQSMHKNNICYIYLGRYLSHELVGKRIKDV